MSAWNYPTPPDNREEPMNERCKQCGHTLDVEGNCDSCKQYKAHEQLAIDLFKEFPSELVSIEIRNSFGDTYKFKKK